MSLPASLAVRVSTYRDNEVERIQLGRRCEIWKQVSQGTSLMGRQPMQFGTKEQNEQAPELVGLYSTVGSCDLADLHTLDT